MYGHHQQQDALEAREFRVLNVRLNPTLHDVIHQIARANGETIASTVRAMLRASVERRTQEAGAVK